MKPASLPALMTVALALGVAPRPVTAQDLPQGLESARLIPGWTTDTGNRIAALELVLEPGWKTYWRSPGDTGLPPEFDWSGSTNVGAVEFNWPAPEVIDSGDTRTLGYHDRLVLPFEITPDTAGQPVDLAAAVDFGLCLNICVPAHVTLTAGPAGTIPDPEIQAALDRVPRPDPTNPECTISEISDGMQVSVALPDPAAEVAALELSGDDDVWASTTEIANGRASADFVAPSGKPFALNPDDVVLTLIGPDGATENQGCRPQPG